MREIQLTQGKVALVDDEDFEELSKFSWQAEWRSRCFYARRSQEPRYMHKCILSADLVDHIDGNTLNNQRSNLRACNQSTNMQNGGSRKGRYKGVSFEKDTLRYRAQIMKDYKAYNLGRYPTAEEAAKAYDVAALRMYGPEATTNASLGLI